MKRLRVLLVLVEPPLPFGNAIGRWFYVLVKELAARGHELSVFATCGSRSEAEKARELFPAPQYDLRLYEYPRERGLRTKWRAARRPHSYVLSDELRRDLRAEAARGFDVLHVEQLWGAWGALDYKERAVINVSFLFEIDLAEQSPKSLKEQALRWLTYRAERKLIRSFPHLAAVSPRLAARLKEINPKAFVQPIPLGIDTSFYPFREERRAAADDAPPIVSLIGSFNWSPTRQAGERLLTRLFPEIKRRIPRAELHLVGRHARAAMSEYLHLPGVVAHENVPDTLPYFEAANVMLYAPSSGSGMKVKVLEAFALGTPVVTTIDGAEGLPIVDGVHAGVCEEDEGLIERTVELLNDAERQQRYRLAARHLIETHCSPRATVNKVEAIYEKIIRHNLDQRSKELVAAR